MFASLLLVSLGATTWLLVDGGRRIVDDVVRIAATAAEQDTSREVARFLATGTAANRQLALAFRAPRVTPDSPGAMQRLIRDIERVTEPGTLSNLYVGLDDGRFYGLTADPTDWPLMHWRYTEASERTGGDLVQYTDANAGRVGPELRRFGPFDPRVRPWYVKAVAEGAPVWTEVYANFGDGTPTITRALAIRDAEGDRIGVAGTDLFVTHVQRFLTSLELSATSEVFVVDERGELVAAWGPAAGGADSVAGVPRIPFEALRYVPYARGLIDATGPAPAVPGAPHFPPTLAAALAVPEADAVSGRVELDGEPGYLSVATLDGDDAPPWRVGVFVPEADYLGSVGEQAVRTVPLGLAVAALSLAGIAGFATLVSRPVRRLGEAADRIAAGRFDEPVEIPAGREVGTLARAIDDMRVRLGASFEALDAERERAAATLDAIEDAVLAVDEGGLVTLANPAASRLLGRPVDALRGEPVERALPAREARTGLSIATRALRGELAKVRRDGLEILLADPVGGAGQGERAVRLAVAPLGGGLEPRGAVLVLHDSGAAARRGAELAFAASHDALTGLANRRELEARIERAILEARERGTRHALAFLDLDRFGRVNEAIGRAGGDELLRQVGATIETALAGAEGGPDDALGSGAVASAARVGGDEFAVLLEGVHGARARERFVAVRDAVADLRFAWTDRSLGVAVSVGTVAITADTLDAGSALSDAATACALARRDGENRLRAHEESRRESARREGDRAALARIAGAIDADRLELHAQRIVRLDGAAVPDAELLVRLRETDGSLAPPASFVPTAERLGVAGRLDRHVVGLALEALARRDAASRGLGRCSINLSGASLGDAAFLPWLLARVERLGVDPATLAFEITETVAISHLSTARALMRALGERGAVFALDDFGTGLSSFAWLKALPIDALKIDASFVADVTGDARDAALVRSMVELARSLGIGTVAEGVEDEPTLEALRALGVERVQGFLLDRPAPFGP